MIEIRQFEAAHLMALYDKATVGMSIEDAQAHAELRACAGPAWTALVDGKPIGAAGIVMYWPGVGEAWTLFTPEILRRRLWLCKFVPRFIASAIKELNLHRLQVAVKAGEEVNNKWARWLGFSEPMTLAKYGPDKSDYVLYFRGE